jgi:dipeptidyl-peptidase-4
MKKFLVFVSFILLSTVLIGQKKSLTIEQAVLNIPRDIYLKQLSSLSWKDNNVFTYSKGDVLYQQSVKSAEETKVLDINDLFEITKDSVFKKIKFFPQYEWNNDGTIWIKATSNFYNIDLTKKLLISKIICTDSAENFDLNKNKKIVAFTLGNNLYIRTSNYITRTIEYNENKGIVCGKSVHRNEFGINKGTFWSNTGKYLAYYRMDETMVTNYPLVDITTRVASLRNIRYPMAGMTSHEVTVGVYDVEANKKIYLKTGEPKDQYLTNICWTPDDKYIIIAVLNREQNHMKLNMYAAETGEFVKTLFEEKNEKYVEPLNAAYFIDNTTFIWQSQRDGYNHLYLYDINKGLIKQLTKGEWVVTELLGLDSKKENIFFEAAYPNALERHILKLNIKTTEVKPLTQEEGTHEAIFNKDFTYFIDRFENVDLPFVYYLRANNKILRTIAEYKGDLHEYDIPKVEIVKIKADDGKTDLYGRIIKPSNFVEGKKYPLILYVYGGPHAQLVRKEWLGGASLWDVYMAQNGYVVATVDNRGSANRGFEFESCIHRQLGVIESKDQLKFVKYLISLGFVDESKIGVFGWSFGGFMTLTLMTDYPDIFKVGVAGGPVVDWKYYEIMYGERYMDTPQENPDGYEKTSLLNKAKNLKGKTLIIHGYIDDVVVLQHSLTFLEECIKNNIQVDYFVYPTHEHNVRGKDRIHLMKKVTEYFDDFLKK